MWRLYYYTWFSTVQIAILITNSISKNLDGIHIFWLIASIFLTPYGITKVIESAKRLKVDDKPKDGSK